MNSYLIFDIETGGLSPLSASISCICCRSVDSKTAPVCFSGDFEATIIKNFVSFLEKEKVTHLVTYNGWAFDVPFLRVRAMANGIKLPPIFWDDSKLVDPYHILARNKTGKQHEFGDLFGAPTVGSGLECLSLFQKGDFSKIEEHCKSDVLVLDCIFHKMLDSGFVG